jgi:hypothetical protein
LHRQATQGNFGPHAADGPVPRGRGIPIFLFLRRITFMVNLGRI